MRRKPWCDIASLHWPPSGKLTANLVPCSYEIFGKPSGVLPANATSAPNPRPLSSAAAAESDECEGPLLRGGGHPHSAGEFPGGFSRPHWPPEAKSRHGQLGQSGIGPGGARCRPTLRLSCQGSRRPLGRLLRLTIRLQWRSGRITRALPNASYSPTPCRFKPGCFISYAFSSRPKCLGRFLPSAVYRPASHIWLLCSTWPWPIRWPLPWSMTGWLNSIWKKRLVPGLKLRSALAISRPSWPTRTLLFGFRPLRNALRGRLWPRVLLPLDSPLRLIPLPLPGNHLVVFALSRLLRRHSRSTAAAHRPYEDVLANVLALRRANRLGNDNHRRRNNGNVENTFSTAKRKWLI